MNNNNGNGIGAASLYATFWRMLYLGVHRYESNPTGELLTVMAIALLDRIGYQPTVADLTRLTGLTKSSVARYVSRQMEKGYLTEIVDSADRRMRRLCPTEKGKREEEWNRTRSLEIAVLDDATLDELQGSEDPVGSLRAILVPSDDKP